MEGGVVGRLCQTPTHVTNQIRDIRARHGGARPWAKAGNPRLKFLNPYL